MNKKGLSYVDWAISFGLFVVYLLVIFIFIKPEIINSYDEDFLNSIVKQGLEEDAYSEFTRYPLFINANSTGDYISLELIDSFQFLNNTNIIILDAFSTKLNITILNNRLNFDYNFDSGMNEFEIIYSPYVSYVNTAPGGVNPISANYTIGIAETKKGIFNSSLTDLQTIGYYELKEEWGYPIQNEFTINIYEGSDLSVDPKWSYEHATPQIDSKINVLMWSDWEITNQGSKELITILIKTW